MSAMTLAELLGGIASAQDGGIAVSGLTQDSNAVRAGDAFVALAGAKHHGIEFAPAAVARGAVVVLAEKPEPGTWNRGPETGSLAASTAPRSAVPGPVVWVDQLRTHLGEIAARFHGDPSASMTVVGVTGTNGKTSTVQLLAQAFTLLGHRAATIGTLGAGLHGALHEGERTTPDVIRVHGLLAQFREAGATHVAMEVSSHALDQHRVDGVRFGVAVFTNLTRDHLDYHHTMEAYGAAKARLFEWPGLSVAVINVDDAFGRELAAKLPVGVRALRYAIGTDDAELRARDVHTHSDGIDFRLVTPWGGGTVRSRLLGRFNVANLLAVAGVLGALDVPFARITAALESLQPVAGRMSRIGGGALPLVVVDYSHTPDALEQALLTLRAHCPGKLVCVFGCGGERDAGKRPEMGAIAERLADLAIVTDDNPRGEDGDAIVAQIVAGMRAPERAIVERDRARAIGLALTQAAEGDVVLLAGKGHEAYQESGGVKRPFDDLQVAHAALEARPC
ncbi:MAG TPA: UDP-N-acetylmuramoyl-L-alanyl-D-glutamate--2,6-diaminopimelate ligase [Rhodanobacteraceae bacterium]|jgi:UDP-N-acetylmuramoyl-L-alanyl-D-glutamate--2,6-diaminopimelate ligase|nr:UDP-N-acetylmuramoyl-L-alanyl-D-glutamate--2,6-diaminopimelate ligase [Rhodanobacteraceae bacterium]